MKNYIKLLRIQQWYKNLLIYLPLIFGKQLFNVDSLLTVTLGFISLCFISSANYIINDISDLKKDKLHPEKSKRPLASGKITIKEAIFFALLSLILSLIIAINLPFYFLLSVASMFILTQLYSLYLKNILFIDVILIAINFVIRTISGFFIINIMFSPWLIICPFFLSLFLSIGKRESEARFIKKAYNHRTVLKHYTHELTHTLMIVSVVSLIITYTLFTFLSQYPLLILTLPIVVYAIFRYFSFIYTGSIIARHPEKIIKDKPMAISLLIWLISVLFIVYVI